MYYQPTISLQPRLRLQQFMLDVHGQAGVEGQTDKPRPHVCWADVVRMNSADIQQA